MHVYCEKYVLNLINHSETVCLRDKEGKAVAFAMIRDDDAIGLLHVSEEYRGQGLGKYIVASLIEKAFTNQSKEKMKIFSEIVPDNIASISTFKSLSFQIEPETLFWFHI